MTLQEAIEKWVKEYQDRHFKLNIAGSIASFIGALPVLFITWWVVYFVLWFAFGVTGISLLIWTWSLLAMLFVAYLTANYEELENLKFGSLEQARKVRLVARATGNSYMSLFANQETFRSMVKILSVSILAGPALLMTGIRLARRAHEMKVLDEKFLAPFLIKLAKAGQRIPMDKLAADLRERSLADLIEQMSLIDGVIVRTQSNAGMYLTEDLQAALGKARDARKSAE